VNLYFPVAADEALFAKFVHKEADARPGRADHFRQCFLTEDNRGRFGAPLFAEIREKQKKASEPSFAGIE
jgi:hypothetical protein